MTEFEHVGPADIERRSMQIIESELAARGITPVPAEAPFVKRAIHTTADFDYAENLVFLNDAARRAVEAARLGCDIVFDTNMGLAGANKAAAEQLGCSCACHMADPDVAEVARTEGTTRAVASTRKAARLHRDRCRPFVFAIGNAPTALACICDLVDSGELRPDLVIGAPVGFVNVVASKELALDVCARHGIPAIVARGRKGGSNLAAALVNAALYEAIGRTI